MRRSIWLFRLSAFLLSTFLAPSLPAATLYVDLNSPGPAAPFTNWATAATNIQDAIDAASPGDTVLVTNGIYATGGRVIAPSLMTNRIVVNKAISLQSVNGPSVTVISGVPVLGTNAVRCVFLTNGASISGFTTANGGTRTTGIATSDRTAGGILANTTNAIVSNCIVENCLAAVNAGGIYSATVYNTFIASNSLAGVSGCTLANCAIFKNNSVGAVNSKLYNCTVTQNSATNLTAAGISGSTTYNSIVCSNTGMGVTSNYDSSSRFTSSCTFPLPPTGSNNINLDPQIVDFYHLASNSPCRGAGNSIYNAGSDLDGESWQNPPSMGCDEYYPGGPLTIAIGATYTNGAANFTVHLFSRANGSQSGSLWDFGDGTFATNQLSPYHSWANPGDYNVTLTAYNDDHPAGVSGSLPFHIVAQPIHYVSVANATPVAPYTNWATAATNIQDAVDAATTWGAMVLVSDGVYQFGGHPNPGNRLTNRVAIPIPLSVQSVNGPSNTVIGGIYNVFNPVRCVSVTNGALLGGFTLSNGVAPYSGNQQVDAVGGGAFCFSSEAVISNCVITSNTALTYANGVFGGTIYNSLLCNNGSVSTFETETGGGAYGSALQNCTLAGNVAVNGGGAALSILNNCLLSNNVAIRYGGASYSNTSIRSLLPQHQLVA